MKEDIYRSQFRLPYQLYEQIKAAADANRRSVNAELVARLETTFSGGSAQDLVLSILGLESPRRIREQSSTYAARDDLICLIRNLGNINEVLLAVRDGNHNHSALTVVIKAGDLVLLADHTLLTIERRARELEVQDVILNLDQLGLLEGASSFVTQRVDKTSRRPVAEAVDYLSQQEQIALTPKTLPIFLKLFMQNPIELTEANLAEYLSA